MHFMSVPKLPIFFSYETLGSYNIETDLPSQWTTECLRLWLLKKAHALTPKKVIATDTSLFEQGFDRSAL
jgi:hypothetical protein